MSLSTPPRSLCELVELVELAKARQGFSDYFVWWDGQQITMALGVRARVVLEGESIRVSDGAHRVIREVTTTDPFGDVGRLLSDVVAPPFRAWGYLGFGLASFRYPYANPSPTELHLIVPDATHRFDPEVDVSALVQTNADAVEHVARAAVGAVAEGRANYQAAVEEVLCAIREGKVDKVILSRQVVVPGRLDPLATFAASAQTQAARRFAFRLGTVAGAGACPEILLVADAERRVITNPLAGTQPRGKTPEEDARLRAHLLRDAKEVSEHAMSIRLAYEEIAEVCTVESTRVIDFMRVKQYPFTQHLSSRAAGMLDPDRSSWDALRAVFPGVTTTGIAKKDAIEWIARLEQTPRGVYGGAVGWVDDNNAMDWGIAIRSTFDYGEGVTLRAGAGIVLDSDPAYEFDESAHKMRTMASRIVLAR